MDREAEALGDRRQGVAVGGMQPFGTAIERKPLGGNRMNPAADAVARLEHQQRDCARFAQPPCRADPGGAGADHRDIDVAWKTSHLCPRRPASAQPGAALFPRLGDDLADELVGHRIGE